MSTDTYIDVGLDEVHTIRIGHHGQLQRVGSADYDVLNAIYLIRDAQPVLGESLVVLLGAVLDVACRGHAEMREDRPYFEARGMGVVEEDELDILTGAELQEALSPLVGLPWKVRVD